MNPAIQLQLDEYIVAQRLAQLLKKKDGYSIHIPFNRQQKGFDLLVHSAPSGKSARIQVKGSGQHKAGSKDSHGQRRDHAFWFNWFECGAADYYVLVGLYPEKKRKVRADSRLFWKPRMLMLPEDEMKKVLEGIKTKSGKTGHSFYLEFTEGGKEEIYLTRGAAGGKKKWPYGQPLNKFAIEKTIRQLKGCLR